MTTQTAPDTATTEAPTGDPIGWFEIGTPDAPGARAFYGTVFGWTFGEDGPYSLITTGAGHALQGGIQDTSTELPPGQPTTYAVPCVQVADVAATCEKVTAAGGTVVLAATKIPTGLVYGMVADPAGNRVGVFSPPELT
jgi:predicted enzyme related to lactoylglutathione lyase